MPNSICTTCTRASVCADRSYSMVKCDRYDPIFNAVQAAVNTYGVDKQLNVFYGEIGELMTAVADHRRGRDTTDRSRRVSPAKNTRYQGKLEALSDDLI